MSRDINIIIGANLKCLRTKLYMKQSEFCKLCEVNQSQYSKIEKGKCPLTVENLFKIAENVGIDPLELLKCESIPYLEDQKPFKMEPL